MKEKKCSLKNSLLKYIVPVILVICSLTIFITAFYFNFSYNSNLKTENDLYEENWEIIIEDEAKGEIKFPFTISDGKRECIIYTTLPKSLSNKDRLILEYQYQDITVYVDGEEVYKSSYPHIGNTKTILGTNVLSIPMKEEYTSKLIELKMVGIKPIEPVAITHIYLTTAGDYLYHIYKTNVVQLLISSLLLATSVIYFIVYFTGKIKKVELSVPLEYFISLAIFSFSLAIWIVSDLHLLFVMTGHIVVNDILSYYSFMSIPIGFIPLVRYLIKRYEKAFIALEYVFSANILIQTILFLTGAVDLANMIIVTQGLIILGLVLILVLIIVAAIHKMTKERMILIIGFAAFAVTIIISLFGFLFGSSDFNYNTYFLIGLLIIMILFAYTILKEFIIVIGEHAHIAQTIKYAYTDVLTGVGNRRLYEESISNEKLISSYKHYVLFAFDINFLKDSNDNLGHDAGDELIVASAKIITEVFSDFEKTNIFRTGGDEFTAICSYSKKEIDNKINEFKAKMSTWKGAYNSFISIAYGYASKEDYPDISIRELRVKADEAMYIEKRKAHEARHDKPRNEIEKL